MGVLFHAGVILERVKKGFGVHILNLKSVYIIIVKSNLLMILNKIVPFLRIMRTPLLFPFSNNSIKIKQILQKIRI